MAMCTWLSRRPSLGKTRVKKEGHAQGMPFFFRGTTLQWMMLPIRFRSPKFIQMKKARPTRFLSGTKPQ